LRTADVEGREDPVEAPADSHSGRLLVRMPKSLHGDLVRVSEREGTSLNGYIVAALASSVAWRRSDDTTAADGHAGAARESTTPGRGLSLALTANMVVLAVAAAIALALLITAWQN